MGDGTAANLLPGWKCTFIHISHIDTVDVHRVQQIAVLHILCEMRVFLVETLDIVDVQHDVIIHMQRLYDVRVSSQHLGTRREVAYQLASVTPSEGRKVCGAAPYAAAHDVQIA
jgi:hypothetical protein